MKRPERVLDYTPPQLEPRLILVRSPVCEFMAGCRETFTFRRNCSLRVLHLSVSSMH